MLFNDKFQQSNSYMFSKVAQVQFINRVLDFPVVQRGHGPHSATVQKTNLIPQVQFLGKVVAPVLCNDRCVDRWCSKLWLFRSCCSSAVVVIPFVPQRQIPMVRCQVIDALIAHVVLDMPVVVQRQLLMVQMTSRLSPYSALSLVRQRIHAVRQSTRLSGRISHYFSSGR